MWDKPLHWTDTLLSLPAVLLIAYLSHGWYLTVKKCRERCVSTPLFCPTYLKKVVLLQLQSTLTISVSLLDESFNRNGISNFHVRSQKPTTLRYVFRNQANCFANSPSLYIHPYTSLCLQRCYPFVDSWNFCCKFVIVRVQTHLSSPPHEEMSTTTSTTIILWRLIHRC